jgi:hypothetical protein
LGGFAGSKESNGLGFPNNCIKHLFNHNVTCTFLSVFETQAGGFCVICGVLGVFMADDIFSGQDGDSPGCGIEYASRQHFKRF